MLANIYEGILLFRIFVCDMPSQHELLTLLIKCERCLCNLFKRQTIPLLFKFSVDFKTRSQASCIMFGNKLVQQAFYEKLKREAFGHFTVIDEVVTLTDYWNVFLL